ncbi:30S ribosomal protein S2 [Candidatus Gracilibacteria bacterium]|nr:30S ribosomal protein S2 [Candidatus Gracilibacteria bacterium]MCF7855975.1 30S ribosomal protein S2 [Candidatus Gracilibacteria bacterium]MCF7896332.1 30S ribosomal protein S2 [Candidatus Gracilibacteria bacterium]
MNNSDDLRRLLVAGLHFGHKTAKWNPKMKPFIFGERNGIHIFDLEKTAEYLKKAMEFLEKSAQENRTILLVSTKQQTLESVPDLAVALNCPYVTEKWFGGLLTNWNTTKERIRQLRDLKKERDETAFSRYLKKERNSKLKQITKLELWLAGIEKLEKKPDVVFVLDTVKDKLAVREANKCGIPVVAVVDSNADPDLVNYPIPANDDSVKSIQLILNEVHEAIERGQKTPAVSPKKAEPEAQQTEKK